jgi:Zn-finger nucleic acid-binding protein
MKVRVENGIGYTLFLGLGIISYVLLITLAGRPAPYDPASGLSEISFRGIPIDHCSCCGGIWLDRGELADLMRSLGISLEGYSVRDLLLLPRCVGIEKPRSCPKCGNDMVKVALADDPHLMVDVCVDGDGLWFDGEECAAFVAGLQELGHPMLQLAGAPFIDGYLRSRTHSAGIPGR